MGVRDRAIGEYLDALGAPRPSPASGSGAALTGAIAAALAELAAGVSGQEDAAAEARGLRGRLAELADEDAAAYEAFLRERGDAERDRIVDVPLAIAEAAAAVAALADRLAGTAKRSVTGDAEAAAELARGAAAVGARLVTINLSGRDDPRLARARAAAPPR